MRYLKMLGPAAVTAMGLMVFLGAGSASATVACTTTDTPACLQPYGQGTVIDFSLAKGGSKKLTGSGGEVIATCTEGTLKGRINNSGGATETVSMNIESLTWGGCSQTTDTVANGSLEFHWIEGTHNATVTGSGGQWTNVIFGVSCTYGTGTGTHVGTLTGGKAPILSISTTVTKTAGGFLCPSTSGWDASYEVTEPHALYFTPSW